MLQRRQILLAKIEAGYGTDPTPTGAADAVLAYDIDLTQTGEVLERPILRPTLSHLPPVIGMQEQSISFKVELIGVSVTVGAEPNPKWTPLLSACGFATLAVDTALAFSSVSQESAMKSVTIYAYVDGNLHIYTGCRGNARINLEAGQYGFIEFEMTGLFNTAVTATTPTVTGADSNIIPPIVVNSAFTIGTYIPVTRSVVIDLRNNITRRESIVAKDGVHSFRLADRNPQITWDADAVTEATNPFWQNWDESTGKPFNVHFGSSSAGNRNTFGISCPLFVSETIKYGDDDGVLTYDIVGVAAGSAPAGNDEFTLYVS